MALIGVFPQGGGQGLGIHVQQTVYFKMPRWENQTDFR